MLVTFAIFLEANLVMIEVTIRALAICFTQFLSFNIVQTLYENKNLIGTGKILFYYVKKALISIPMLLALQYVNFHSSWDS